MDKILCMLLKSKTACH